MKEKEWKKWLFWFSFVVATIIVYKTIDSVFELYEWLTGFISILMPFILAVIFAYILYKPANQIEKWIKKVKFLQRPARFLSVIIVYILVVTAITVVFNFIIPIVSINLTDLAKSLPEYYNSAIDYINNIPEDSIFANLNLQGMVKSLEEIDISRIILDILDLKNIGNIIKGLSGATSIIFNTFITVMVSVYLLLERSDIKSFIKNVSKAVLKKETYERLKGYYNKTDGIFYNFLSSQILDAFLVGSICSVILNIMKVKFAGLLAIMIGVFNVIPYFGAIVACSIAVIITIFTGGIEQAMLMLVVILILQQIDSNIINPRILGTNLDISPILVIFSVTVGGAYFGVLGMFLGVPFTAFVKIIIVDLVNEKLKEKEAKELLEEKEKETKAKKVKKEAKVEA